MTPTDFLESDIRPMISTIITEIDTGPDIKSSASKSGKFPSECKEVLKSLLTSPVQEPHMSQIPFYHANKEGAARMGAISRKLMNVKLVPVIACHLLEWCIQVLDKVSWREEGGEEGKREGGEEGEEEEGRQEGRLRDRKK